MSNATKNKIYDFVFIGLGASNSLILISLIKKGLLKNKQIAVFEADSKTINDKTYCFWANSNESIVSDLGAIISYQFTNIQVNATHSENIGACPYHYIRSIDLYNYTLEMLKEAQVDLYRTSVHSIEGENQIYTLHTSNNTFHTNYIFDSRPPSLSEIDKEDIYLNQSFYGKHIKCDKDVFQKDTFEMMNFNVEQNEFTQFMYVIPFSSREALVELTRFGSEKIDLSYASGVLEQFIGQEFGSYEQLGEEIGCIPMTTHRNPVSVHEGVLHTGASANLIKPSTGYGFKNMFEFAEMVTQRFVNNDLKKFNTIALAPKSRFKFYDKLLLLILLHWPSVGKKIFISLYNKVPILTIFSFLEEKSTLRQELKIFAALPFKPFLKALYIHLSHKNAIRYVLAILVVLISAALSFKQQEIATYFNYGVLIIGLFWIGIPHGALDHLLSKDKKTPLILFIAQYVAIMGIYLVLWQISPVISLVVFIVYSSFHFGESELVQNKESVASWTDYTKAFLMGLSILLFIIFTHFEESLNIIAQFNAETGVLLEFFNTLFWTSSIALSSMIYIAIQTAVSRNGSYLGLILLLLLGIFVPLPLAFGLYFILQHSHNAWGHLKRGLNMNTIELYKKSSFFTMGALFLFVIIAFYLRDFIDLAGLWANFFIFIACISLPHFVLMHLFYSNKMNQNTPQL